MQKTINGALLRKMIIGGVALLEKNKDLIDSLNVFPVPDGDTGTNMFLTLKNAGNEVNNCVDNAVANICEAFSKGALRGARGNSGVITSQIIKGITHVLATSDNISTKLFAKALQEGSNVAYKAVTVPKEGTMLTVIRVIGEKAVEIAKKESDFEVFFKLILEEGEKILQQTPEMLPVLKKAGVVDAGGRGIIVILTGFNKILLGEEDLSNVVFDDAHPVQTADDVIADINNLGDIEFAYCTEFMIINMHKKTTEADIEKLKNKLMQLGDSVLCIGDLLLVKVHVHTNTPNIALGYALELGELYNMKIENMLEQNRQLKKKITTQNTSLKEHGMVAIAPGSGIADLMKDLMVDQIIEGGQTMNPSAADIANACDKVAAKNVFVFPNNKNIILAAEQAKALTTKNVVVIPTVSVPEGVSAALCFNGDATLEENKEAMEGAFVNVKSASVTYAVRATHVDGFDLAVGDVIGLDNKAILAKGALINPTTEDLVSKMIDESMVSITLFYGEDVKEEDAEALRESLENKFPDCEITAIYGGQPVYYYIISME